MTEHNRDTELAQLSESLAQLRQDHGVPPLTRRDLDDDPIAQFAKWMEEALEARLVLPNAMTLATATRDGRPSARLVLLKSFDHEGFVFYTNYNSRKGRELDENPRAALAFYWPVLERQIRIEGRAARVARAESEEYFRTRPLGSRLSAWGSEQSSPVESREALENRLAQVRERYGSGDVPLPEFWGGWRVIPDAIEFWKARLNRLHDRFLYSRDASGGWTIVRLSP